MVDYNDLIGIENDLADEYQYYVSKNPILESNYIRFSGVKLAEKCACFLPVLINKGWSNNQGI